MKIYISADIEGVTGVTHWDETNTSKADSAIPREQMTAEVVAACEGALQAGATEIWVKDAHDSARNIIASKLPLEAKLIRGWAPHPLMMLQQLDETFDAAICIGYHARAGANTNPLAHTMSTAFTRITINGQDVSEFWINTHAAAMFKVPVIFVSGDQGLCEEVSALNANIETVAVKEGVGNSTINLHPEISLRQIRNGVAKALRGDFAKCAIALPTHFAVDIQFKEQAKAFTYSFYPGAKLKDPLTVHFEHADYFEVLRLLFFAG